MDWQRKYAAKITTPAAAIGAIRPGRRVLLSSGAAEPVTLANALVAHGDHLSDCEVIHLLTLGPAPYVKPEYAGRFRHTAFFIGANVREAVQAGRADFMPVFLSEIPGLIRGRRVRVDVALIQVSPPDEHGNMSLGVSVDIVRAAVDSAELVIAEVNPRMPRTFGDSFVHVDRVAHLIPVDTPLLELAKEPPGEVERAIGAHVASLVPDGATLQTGIGQIPSAVLEALGDRQDLGVHTEMFSDGIMKLAKAGVITGARKTLLPRKIVTSFIMGSADLYAWAHENPALEFRASDFTNDPRVVAEHDHMIAINAALAVDLTGQVAADTLMGRFFSGIGGQVDFVRGAARSRGGKAIIALPSTAKNGSVSRIQAAFEAGAGVVTSRGDVRYVVTEFGVADLWGKNIRERATALIEIAHPDFRTELLAGAKQRRFVFPDQVAPLTPYPWSEARAEKLDDGRELFVRPARLSDEEALQRLFYDLSEESVRQRFLEEKRVHTHAEMQELLALDYVTRMAFVVEVAGGGGGSVGPEVTEVVGFARYEANESTKLARVSFVVRDDWQGHGVGSRLLARLADAARERGLLGVTAEMHRSNEAMLLVFHRSGLEVQTRTEGERIHIEARFGVNAARP